jgi:hypothetical protein
MNSYSTIEDWQKFPLKNSDYWNYPEFGSSNVTWKSGSMNYSRFNFYGNSNFEFVGGSIDAMMLIAGTSNAHLTGGNVAWAISAMNQGKFEIDSGYVRVAQAQDEGHITYKGGDVGIEINLRGNASLDVFGSNLSYKLLQHSNLWGRDEYLLTGFLSDGSQLSTNLNLYDGFNGNVNLNNGVSAVPEPTSFILLAIGGTLLAGSCYFKRLKH